MRQSLVVTISLPSQLVDESEKWARRKHMTRSEFFRAALRRHLEEQDTLEAVRIYRAEKKAGKLKELRGSLVDLMKS